MAEGRTLSEWLREAGRQRLEESAPARLTDLDSLDAFFAECDAAEEGSGAEPDWAEVRACLDHDLR